MSLEIVKVEIGGVVHWMALPRESRAVEARAAAREETALEEREQRQGAHPWWNPFGRGV